MRIANSNLDCSKIGHPGLPLSTTPLILPTTIRATPALFHVVPDLGAGAMIYILVS